jgi:hypothetical protein
VSELYIIWRIGIHEIRGSELHTVKILTRKIPLSKNLLIFAKFVFVCDVAVRAEWDVEFATSIESAKAIETCAIQIIKKGGSFETVALSRCE